MALANWNLHHTDRTAARSSPTSTIEEKTEQDDQLAQKRPPVGRVWG
jgi:hypothetical protein